MSEIVRPTTSSRDRTELKGRLESWLTSKHPGARILAFEAPDTNGMSSETVLFEAVWTEDGSEEGGAARHERLVARIAPHPDDVPVFPVYDMERQFRAMQVVKELATTVPIPRVLWHEPDPSVLGTPFFVMERVDGRVPPDIMPYTFPSTWVFEANDDEREQLERHTVQVLADLHAIADAEATFGFLRTPHPGDTWLRRHVAGQRAYHDWVVADGIASSLLERAFTWLEDNWPAEETAPVLSWGDSRIGNVLYALDGFHPVAVLDWEMAEVAPREVDIGWLLFLHRFFQDLTVQYGGAGLPELLRPDRVAERYESLTGHRPRDLQWFMTYAAVRHGIVMFRISRRSIKFGEATMPEDLDDLITHRAALEAMLDGTYWERIHI